MQTGKSIGINSTFNLLSVESERRYSYKDYLELEDGIRYELIEGEFLMTPSPTRKHQRTVSRLNILLESIVSHDRLGEVLIAPFVVVLAQDVVVQPDIIYISNDRLLNLTETCMQGPPDLVIEVLSPSTNKYDRMVKSELYYQHGVREYWIVDPEFQTVEVLFAGESGWQRVGVFAEEKPLKSVILADEIKLYTVFGK
jgi:Uma2 family endonuclease